MRQIKFRAWDIKEKEMFTVEEFGFGMDKTEQPWSRVYSVKRHGFTSSGGMYTYPYGTASNALTCILMQFTGLLDKNGKEIYEGDICAIPSMENTIVEYVDDMFHLKSTKYQNLSNGNYRLATYVSVGRMEIIGNIYENSELLK